MDRRLASLAAALLLLTAAPAAAQQSEPQEPPNARQLLDEAARNALRALDLMIKALPQYEAPVVTEDGDIIIRRVRPRPADPEPLPRQKDGGAAT